MDEVQNWWEVPTIAHFCYVFRAAFNLFYFEIGELEAAILNMQDPEMCMSLGQLITRLLQGCYDEDEVTSINWEKKLHELFTDNCEDDEENPLENNAFRFLSPRSKVEVLLKLCEFRLDADGALEAIKDIPSEDMQANCIGKDSQNNFYWYFCDERLYKEDPSVPAKKTKKSEEQHGKGKSTKNSTVKKSTRERKSKSDDINKSWSIVCYNISDWEALVKNFSKSKHKQEKELAKEIKDKYLPILTEVVAEKDRLLRKRFLELAPKRVSQRLSKVQAQKKLEEQIAAEADEEQRIAMEKERVKKEAEKKKQEIESRKNRAEAREKNVQERLWRAQQRDLMRGADVDDFDSDEDKKRTNTRSGNVQNLTADDDEHEVSSEEEDDDEEEEEDASQSESENEQSAKRHSSNRKSEVSDSDKESNNSPSVKRVCTSNGSSASSNRVVKNSFERPSVIHNSYGASNWNLQGDSKGQKIHILRYAYDGGPGNKRLKSNESSYTIGPVTSASTNDARSNYYIESRVNHSLLRRNLNSCTKVTSSPQVIRIDFIKPPKPQVSR